MFFKNKRNIILFSLLTIFILLTTLSLVFYNVYNNADLSIFLLLLSTISLFFAVILIIFENPQKAINTFKKTSNQIPDFIDEFESNTKSGFLIYDDEHKIKFISQSLIKNGFKKNVGEKIESIIPNIKEQEVEVYIHGRNYLIKNNTKKKHLTFINITKEKILEEQLIKSKTAFILINVFYSNKIRTNEIEKFKIQLTINNYFKNWVNKYNAIFRSESSSSENSTILVNWSLSKRQILNGNFINDLISIISENITEISISVGISIGSKNYNKMESDAVKGLELSKNRGGNQIVLIDENQKVTIIGKSSLAENDSSKIKIRMFYDKLTSLLLKMNAIFITSHRMADIDALASSLALAKLIKSFNIDDVKIVLRELDDTAQKAFNDLNFEDKLLFIEEKEALELSTKSSTVIVVDVSLINRTQAPNLIKKISPDNRYLIDHHRLSSDNLDFPFEKTYISVNSSSVSEIISEMIMFRLENEINVLDDSGYGLLVSGIYLDTNNLTRNTSQTTYDILSFLVKQGANINKYFEYSKKNLNYSKILVEAFNSITILGSGIVYATLPEQLNANETEISNISDLLLDFENTEASFVFAKTVDGKFKLSARSNGKINVQIACEKLGGGGHFNSSAASWNKDLYKYKSIKKMIKDVIVETYPLSKKDNLV